MSIAEQILPLPRIEPEIFAALTRELGFVPGLSPRAVPNAVAPVVALTAEVPDLPVLPPLAELTAAPALVALGPARPTPVAVDEAGPAPRSAGVVPPGLGVYQPYDEVVEEDSFDEPGTVVLDLAAPEEILQVEVVEVVEVTDVPDGTPADQADHPVDVADVVSFFARRVPSMPPIAQGDS